MLHKGQCNMWLIASKILQESRYLIDSSTVCLNNQKHCKLTTHQRDFHSTLNDRRQTAENACVTAFTFFTLIIFVFFNFVIFCVKYARRDIGREIILTLVEY